MMKQKEVAALLKAYHAAKIAADKSKALGAAIKEEIAARGGEPLEGSGFIAKVTVCTKKTFDTKRFQQENPELYNKYVKETTESRLYLK